MTEPTGSNKSRATLKIDLIPNDIADFKDLLLLHKSASITIFYGSGANETKHWNASNMSVKSNVIRNIRSRVEFRQGNWQDSNIKRVEVSVNY